jgi:Ca-activated chloride channel family protein
MIMNLPPFLNDAGDFARMATKSGSKDLPLTGIALEATVDGLLLEVVCEQRYRNPYAKAVEIIYTFPVPWGGRLLAVEAWIGERHLCSQVRERIEAAGHYEEAIQQGHSAVLLEDLGHGRWSISLGNLAPGEECRLRLRYAQPLRFNGDSVRVLIPTVIAPCYGKASSGGMPPYQQPLTDLTAEYPVVLRLRVRGELARAALASPSHVLQSRLRDGEIEVSLTEKAWLDRDLVLVLSDLPARSLALTATVGQDHWVWAGIAPEPPEGAATSRGVKILVDCSGSMGGDSIAAARRALSAFIRDLGESDRFSLSRFGSTVEHRSNGLWAVSSATRQAALRWVDGLQADLGGTEMEDALESTFALRCGEVTDVLLVTDGAIVNVDGTVAAARRSGHRVFVVAIGSSPAEPLLRQLADATGGACEFVAPREDVETAIARMLHRLGGVRLSGLRLEWPSGIRPLSQSGLLSAAFAGDTLSVWARLDHQPSGVLRLLAGVEDEVRCLAEAAFRPTTVENDAVVKMAACAEAEALLAAGDREAALALSLRYGVLNTLTAAVMVLQRAEGEQLGDMPEQVVIPQMQAAGWSGAGSVALTPDVFIIKNCMSAPRMAVAEAVSAFASAPFDVFSTIDASVPPPSHARGRSVQPRHLREQVTARSQAAWPRDYRGLAYVFGLEQALLDWLEWVAAPELGMSESEMVRLLLTLFAGQEAERLMDGLEVVRSQKDASLGRLAAALQGMTPETWPDSIRDMSWRG